jgi:hypothetical protein
VTVWASQNEYKLVYHGGGRTNDAEDNLYKFKKQFGQHTEFPFYIGKKIWNQDIYDKLCEKCSFDEAFFQNLIFPASYLSIAFLPIR